MGKKLYRITSLEGFLSLIFNKTERYVHPIECWEDTYEGYMLHRLDSEDGTRQVLHELYEVISPNNAEIAIRNYTKLLRARYECYGQCWSTVLDSDAMWRIYSYGNKSIQIISNSDRIKNMIKQSMGNSVTIRIGNVNYDINENSSDLSQVLYDRSRTNEPYYHKREAFEHEKEVRVIISLKEQFSDYTDFSEQAILANFKKNKDPLLNPVEKMIRASNAFDRRGDFYRRNFDDVVYVDVADILNYIIGVRVHPQAENWYVELIGKICAQFGIPFLGQSSLYKKP